MFKWTMKLWRRNSFIKPLHQWLYNHPSKLIQTFTNSNLTQQHRLPPTSIPYSHLLTQSTVSKSFRPGKEIHCHIIKHGFSKDPKFRNQLINLYSKCRIFRCARKLVDESPEPDLVSWSALISGYAQNGLPEEALSAFRKLVSFGVKCNEFTFPSVLKACTAMKDLKTGMQVHGIVVVTGFESDEYVANALVVAYAKCGELRDSRRLFDAIPTKSVVSWNGMFSCYVQSDYYEEAVEMFGEMVASGISPNEFSLSSMINACTGLMDAGQGRKIHGCLVKLGYDSDPFSLNALVDMYAKLGYLDDAVAVFDKIAEPDIVSWNAVIAGCVLHECDDSAVELFREMKRTGTYPNMFTLSSALKACAGMKIEKLGRQLHCNLIKSDVKSDSFLIVGLIDMYAKCNVMEDAKTVFELMRVKDMIAWNAMISGYSLNGEDRRAVSLFSSMYTEGVEFNVTTLSTVLKSVASLQASDVCKQVHVLSTKSGFRTDNYVVNSLIDAYGKCGLVEQALKILHECGNADFVAFTSMIATYAQYGRGEEALKLYSDMRERGVKPDSFVCSSILNACANLSAYEQGKQVHVHVLKFGFMSDIFAGNSLVNMYAKCGSIDDAGCAFTEIPQRGIVSWSAMIGGLAQHGHGRKAIELFDEMIQNGVSPNHITLVSVLSACNHAGLVNEATRYFESMENRFGIEPTQEHYACMIDILARSGRLNDATELVDKMPFEANGAVWGALLGAARIHKDIELGQRAADMLLAIEPEKSGTHVLLANIYASVGMWDDVAKMRRIMKDNNVKKEPGMSWVEIQDKIYTFIVGDRSHRRSEEIYGKLDELGDLLNKAGYVPMVETDLHDVEPSQKEELLYHHSEKLAVAFALIATPAGAPIRVKKNLRICVDCHTVFKFVCKIVSREIIVRDVNRFHHFRDGSCSCGDYW